MWAQRHAGTARGGLHAFNIGVDQSRREDEGRRLDGTERSGIRIKGGQHQLCLTHLFDHLVLDHLVGAPEERRDFG
jgi:hypothetical protein